MMTFHETAQVSSDILNCTYAVGFTDDGKYVYVWQEYGYVEGEIEKDLIESPECMQGALVGTRELIVDDIEDCVGGFRYHGDEEQQGESADIVEELLEGIAKAEEEMRK